MRRPPRKLVSILFAVVASVVFFLKEKYMDTQSESPGFSAGSSEDEYGDRDKAKLRKPPQPKDKVWKRCAASRLDTAGMLDAEWIAVILTKQK